MSVRQTRASSLRRRWWPALIAGSPSPSRATRVVWAQVEYQNEITARGMPCAGARRDGDEAAGRRRGRRQEWRLRNPAAPRPEFEYATGEAACPPNGALDLSPCRGSAADIGCAAGGHREYDIERLAAAARRPSVGRHRRKRAVAVGRPLAGVRCRWWPHRENVFVGGESVRDK